MNENFTKKRQQEIRDNKILIYGKGTKLMPMCGFTADVIALFQEVEKPFSVINILDDPELREGLKEFSGWPTFPQIYINGEFIGGRDIVREMYEAGELNQIIEEAFAN